jgi:hypothetical protein
MPTLLADEGTLVPRRLEVRIVTLSTLAAGEAEPHFSAQAIGGETT